MPSREQPDLSARWLPTLEAAEAMQLWSSWSEAQRLAVLQAMTPLAAASWLEVGQAALPDLV